MTFTSFSLMYVYLTLSFLRLRWMTRWDFLMCCVSFWAWLTVVTIIVFFLLQYYLGTYYIILSRWHWPLRCVIGQWGVSLFSRNINMSRLVFCQNFCKITHSITFVCFAENFSWMLKKYIVNRFSSKPWQDYLFRFNVRWGMKVWLSFQLKIVEIT